MLLRILRTILALQFLVRSTIARFEYSMSFDKLCYNDSSRYLKALDLINDRQCAISCFTTTDCGNFMIVPQNKTCILYKPLNQSCMSPTTNQSEALCRTATLTVITPTPTGYVIITDTANWTVPFGVKSFTAMCIGGGAGGISNRGTGGGGSGYLAYGTVDTIPLTQYLVTIGAGGAADESGETSSIGSVIVANGSLPTNCFGGDGGSGGGAGVCQYKSKSGSGGSAGRSGSYSILNNTNYYRGGSGQGSLYWSQAFAAINSTYYTVTAGDGGSGNTLELANYTPGGGGGGGIIVNGASFQAGNGTSLAGGSGGWGYGAGGGSAGCVSGCSGVSVGGSGNAGVCIIKWGNT